MLNVTPIARIENEKNIAIMDSSSVSFMQVLCAKNVEIESVLKDYDLILIPCWVLTEICDAEGRAEYIQKLIDKGFPIHSVAEEGYSGLANNEEGNLYQIVLAAAQLFGRLRSYLRRFVEASDVLDMKAYGEWIGKLYEEWPLPGDMLSSGRIKKKNAGEFSITILTEVLSWYYPKTETLTVYSQDRDTYEFQHKAESTLMEVFADRIPVPVSYKSNDGILCQLFRDGLLSASQIKAYRKDERRLTFGKEQPDHSMALVTKVVDNDEFIDLVRDETVRIIF